MSLTAYFDSRDGEHALGLLLPMTMLTDAEIEEVIVTLGISGAVNFRRAIATLREERPEVHFLRTALRNPQSAATAVASAVGIADTGAPSAASDVSARLAELTGTKPADVPKAIADQVVTVVAGLTGGAIVDHIAHRAMARRRVPMTKGRSRVLSAASAAAGLLAAELLDE